MVCNLFVHRAGAFVPKWLTNVSMKTLDAKLADTYLVKPDCIVKRPNLDDRRMAWVYIPQDTNAKDI